MILKTFDGKEVYVTKDQADRIAQAVNNGTKLIEINTADRKVFVNAGAIASIMSGGEPPMDKSRQIASKSTLTPEEEAAKRERGKAILDEMRENLRNKGILKKA